MKYTRKWLKCALIRAARTMIQTAVALMGTNTFLHEIDLRLIASASVLAGMLSVLTSLTGLPEAETEP